MISLNPAAILGRRHVVLSLFLSGVACSATAQMMGSSDSTATLTSLDPVVVTAERSAQPLSASLTPTVVIDHAQIEQAQAVDIATLLASVAGLEVARSGGPGAVSSVFIRGGESNHTLVLIDGVPMNPASAGGAALPNISTDMIERIEVIEGPRSTLYGSAAIAGVVNIITRAPQARQFSASAKGGSYGTYGGTAAYADHFGAYGIALETEQQHSDGFPTCADGGNNSGFDNRSFNLRGSADYGSTQLQARAWRTQGKSDYVDSCSPDYGLNPLSQAFLNEVLAFSLNQQIGHDVQTNLTASRAEDRVQQYQLNYDPIPDYVRTIRPGVDWDTTWNVARGGWLGANQLGFGAAFAQNRVDALSYGTQIDENTETGRIYLRDRADLKRHHVLAAISAQHDSGFGNTSVWNAEYGFDATARTRLTAGTGTGFRAPDADDRYGFGGNPDLKPERARNYELGLRQRIGEHQAAELQAFRNSVTDLIVVEYSPTNDPNVDYGYKAVNIDRARTDGVQAAWRYVEGAWSARINGIIQNPKDLSDDTQLLRRARRSLSGGVTRQLGIWHINADALATSSRADIDANTGMPVTDGGYVLLNAGGGVNLGAHWSAEVRVNNLLDRDYQTAAGYRQPGTAAYATLRYATH